MKKEWKILTLMVCFISALNKKTKKKTKKNTLLIKKRRKIKKNNIPLDEKRKKCLNLGEKERKKRR